VADHFAYAGKMVSHLFFFVYRFQNCGLKSILRTETKKPASLQARILWLPDLDSNQGPAD
jgi:hypothetical protein